MRGSTVGQFESRFTTFSRDHSYLINKAKKKSSTRSSLGNMASLWQLGDCPPPSGGYGTKTGCKTFD